MVLNLPHEVFLSHSGLDRQFATDLAAVMRRHGIPVWHSQTNIVGAQRWIDEIGEALKRCDWFAVVLSPQSVESMWVRRELSYALLQDKFENRIVPIEYQACSLEQLFWTLKPLQRVDFTGRLENGYRDLLRIWGLGYQP